MTTTGRSHAATLDDLPGLWRRTLLVSTDGSENTTTDVRWIQAGSVYVDLRIPPKDDDSSAVEGFAGMLHFDGVESFEWRRDIDLGPPIDPPDAGTLHFMESVLVETGIHENYVEHWVKAADSATATAAARLRGDAGEQAIFVLSGSFLGWAQFVPDVGTEISMGRHRRGAGTVTASSAGGRVDAHFDVHALGLGIGRSIEITTDSQRRWTIYFSEGEFS